MAEKKVITPVSKTSYKVSLVVPCYNEEKRVPQMLDGLKDFSQNWNKDYEIIVVDDGSKDNTSQLIEQSELYKRLNPEGKFKLIRLEKNVGKGYGLREGVLQATGTHVLTLDADMSSRPTELNNWLSQNQQKLPANEIWIGSRELKTSKVTEAKSRNFIGKVFNLCVRFFTPLNQKDTQCGFKLYPADVAKQVFAQLGTAGWAHDVELLYRAKLAGVTIREMPLTWKTMEGSKISVGLDGFKMFLQLIWLSLRIKFEWFFIAPFREMKDEKLSAQKPLFRFLFGITIVFLFFLMTGVSFHYGITGDDLDQKIYGEKVLNYYTSFGKDTSCLHLKIGNKENLHLYGGLFNMISAAANRYIGGLDEYDMRHLVNALAGWLAILVTGLIARRMGTWLTGFLAVVLLASWPQFFGQSMNNPKDIPFALTYALSIYAFIKLLKELPRPTMGTWILTAVSIALAINIRVGGLMLIGILFAFVGGTYILSSQIREGIKREGTMGYLIGRLAIVTLAGYFGGLLFWPYGLLGPFSHPFEALKEQSNFSMGIGLLFDGQYMSSKEIPWYYIPQWLWITTPLFVLFAAIAQGVVLYFARKTFPIHLTLLIIFATLFPWAYAAYNKSPLYDGMRQFLFITPLIAVLAALSWDYLISRMNNKVVGYGAMALFIFGALLPLRFSFANHPNEYVYFNELIGGIKGAYGKYDTDYYMNSVRKSADWFRASDYFKKATREKKMLIGTNAADPINWYFRNDTDKVKIVYVKWDAPGNPKTRMARDWDYAVFISRDIDPGMLTAGTWPSDKAIYKNSADEVPLSVVIERQNKSDYLGWQALQSGNVPAAEKYFEEALAYNPQNEEAALWMVRVKLALGKRDESQKYAGQYLSLNPNSAQAYSMIGQFYQQAGDNQTANQYYMMAQQYEQAGQKSQQ